MVPAVETNNRGCALIAYNCKSRLMEYLVMHDVPDPRGAFVGTGLAGEFGATLFAMPYDSAAIYGAVRLTGEEEFSLYTYNLFVMVASLQFPSGEIRGQINIEFDWYAYLSGTNVVSPVTTSAVGCATFKLLGEQNRIFDYSIFHTVKLPLQAQLFVGYEGDNGELSRTFRTVFSPIRGDDIILDDDDLQALVTDASYISIASSSYPAVGEIRGQIRRIRPCNPNTDRVLTLSRASVNEPRSTYLFSTVGGNVGPQDNGSSILLTCFTLFTVVIVTLILV